MARIKRINGKTEVSGDPLKVKKVNRHSLKSLHKLVMLNMVLTTVLIASNYEKYIELAKKLANLLGY